MKMGLTSVALASIVLLSKDGDWLLAKLASTFRLPSGLDGKMGRIRYATMAELKYH